MNNGKWVIGILAAGVIVGGLWMRSVAAHQWELTRSFYERHEQVLVDLEAFHVSFRASAASRGADAFLVGSLQASADTLVRALDALAPVNGRTDRTLQLERAYIALARENLFRTSALATPSWLQVEMAFGAMLGPVMLENHAHAWSTPAIPGAMPTPRPKRVI